MIRLDEFTDHLELPNPNKHNGLLAKNSGIKQLKIAYSNSKNILLCNVQSLHSYNKIVSACHITME